MPLKVMIVGVSTLSEWKGGEPEVVRALIKGLENNGIRYKTAGYRLSTNKLSILSKTFNGYFAYDFYLKKLKEERPDIVVGFTDYDFSYIEAAKDLGMPVILVSHIYWLICPKWDLFKWDRLSCEGPVWPECFLCSLKSRNILGLLNVLRTNPTLSKLDFVDRVIAPSKFVADTLSRWIPRSKIQVIYNGVDINFWAKRELPKGVPKVILYYSSPIRSKGFHHFLELARYFKDKHQVEFWSSSPAFRPLFSPKNVKFLGWMPKKELRERLWRSYAVVIPSLWSEPFGLVVAQSMAVGRPVVAYAAGGIKEQIDNMKSGFLVPVGDIHSLKEKLDILLSDRSLAEEMGNNGRRTVEKNFDERDMVKKYVNVITDVVKR